MGENRIGIFLLSQQLKALLSAKWWEEIWCFTINQQWRLFHGQAAGFVNMSEKEQHTNNLNPGSSFLKCRWKELKHWTSVSSQVFFFILACHYLSDKQIASMKKFFQCYHILTMLSHLSSDYGLKWKSCIKCFTDPVQSFRGQRQCRRHPTADGRHSRAAGAHASLYLGWRWVPFSLRHSLSLKGVCFI